MREVVNTALATPDTTFPKNLPMKGNNAFGEDVEADYLR